ncbi:MAG: large-conductance mechanosensitive channel protein MscL [Planctomycetales bacterium]|nr:large-conductance mechanosensitive channel protein MscL [Planctomycetales bacterium]
MSLLTEFKAFAMRGNVVDMAIGIILGGAFGKIVSSLVNDVIMPPIGLLLGGVDFSNLKLVLKEEATDAAGNAVAAVSINYGQWINTIIDFLIVAFAIFMMIKLLNAAKKKETAAPAAPPTPTKEEVLLTEIRDALRSR